MDFIKELEKKSIDLWKKKKELEEEIENFYIDIVKTLINKKIDNIVAIGIYDGKDRVLEEGIIIRKGRPYYINRERDIAIRLDNEDDLRTAVKILFGDLLLLRHPKYALEDLSMELMKKKSIKN